MRTENKIVNLIVKSLKNDPKQWRFSSDSAKNDSKDIGVSFVFGIISTRIYKPMKMEVNFLSKIKLYYAVKKAKKVYIYNQLKS